MSKSRTTISLSEKALEVAKERYEELGYGSVSELIEHLILQDSLEKRSHIVIREAGSVRYQSKSPGEGDEDKDK